jgi:SNF2 family DNA or RNA helicase
VTRTPRPHQHRMIDFVVDTPRCAVWAEPGLGKTGTGLLALNRLAFVEDVFPVLVLAPLRVARSVWREEAKLWPDLQHLRCVEVLGAAHERAAALRTTADVYTMNYENLEWLLEHLGNAWPFKTVIADESTKLKSFRLKQGGARAQALARVAFKSQRWVNLTGTPSPNGLADLWGQTWFLDRGARLGNSFSVFRDRWFRMDRNGYSWSLMPHAHAEIQAKLADICVSMRAADYMTLPPLLETAVEVDLPPAARRLYDEFERKMFAELADGKVIAAGMAMARTSKCLQICNGAVYPSDDDAEPGEYGVVHDAKLEALESIVEESAGAPVLVAYNFRSDLARMQHRFGKRLRHLDTDPRTIDDWNAGRVPVLAAHPASAGHGLSLQHGGNRLVFFGLNWNLEEHLQIIERIGPTRQAQSGYTRPVHLYRIVARDTVDELVLDRLTSKKSVQDILMNALKEKRHV